MHPIVLVGSWISQPLIRRVSGIFWSDSVRLNFTSRETSKVMSWNFDVNAAPCSHYQRLIDLLWWLNKLDSLWLYGAKNFWRGLNRQYIEETPKWMKRQLFQQWIGTLDLDEVFQYGVQVASVKSHIHRCELRNGLALRKFSGTNSYRCSVRFTTLFGSQLFCSVQNLGIKLSYRSVTRWCWLLLIEWNSSVNREQKATVTHFNGTKLDTCSHIEQYDLVSPEFDRFWNVGQWLSHPLGLRKNNHPGNAKISLIALVKSNQ